MSFDPSLPPLVSETLLKARRSLDELQLRRSAAGKKQNQKRRVVRGEDIKLKRPEQFLRAARIRDGSLNKMQRRRKETEKRRAPDVANKPIRPTVGLLVRIHEGRNASDEIKAALRKLGLNRKYDAVLQRLDAEAIARLKPFDAYVAYGYITSKSVEELVHRRAYINVNGPRRPLSDNITVENLLGDKGILCLNDLSNEIYTIGPNFDAAVAIFSTFKLSAPVGSYEKKILAKHDEVEAKGGFLGDDMNDFLMKIL